MAGRRLVTITPEEFDKRLEKSNERLRQELAAAQERIQKLEALVIRKERFNQRLTELIAEIEREESEIKALETEVKRDWRSSLKRRK